MRLSTRKTTCKKHFNAGTKRILVLLAMSYVFGMPFDYAGQCRGDLTVRSVPAADLIEYADSKRGEIEIEADEGARPKVALMSSFGSAPAEPRHPQGGVDAAVADQGR